MARSTLWPLILAVALFLPLAAVPARTTDPADPTEAAAEPAADAPFVPPQIILGTQIRPVFPPAAWDARYTGSVLIEMTVGKDGLVSGIKVVRCTRPKVGFEAAAVAALEQWRFEPGMENGEPVDVTTRLKLNFTRVGVGLQARPQVSAGSFSIASRSLEPAAESASLSSGGASSGDRK